MKLKRTKMRLFALALAALDAGLLAGCAALQPLPGVRANAGDLGGAFDFAQ